MNQDKLFDGYGQNFMYVGAGVFSINHGGLAIYTKYKKNPNRVELKILNSRFVKYSCPDRDLYFVGDANFAQSTPMFDYDEVVALAPFWPNLPLNGIMVNYTQYIGKEHNSPNLRQFGRPEGSPIILSDSGGFQIQSEQLNYINPEHLVKWYNDNADIGIVLDIPLGGYKWKGIVKQAAYAQAANIDLMLANKNERLELMNVIHGYSLSDAKKYRKIVERDEIDRVCLGGLYTGTMMNTIDHACRLMTSGRQYKHYHILGIGKIQQIYALMRMAAKGIAPMITSDSSTWLQEGLNKGYFHWSTVTGAPRYLSLGRDTNVPNVHKHLPCDCPVCSAIKYQDILGCFQGNLVNFLQAYHNLYAFSNFTKAMYEVIRDTTKDDLKNIIKSQLETRSKGRDESLAAIDYVDSVASDGCDYAARKVAYYLNYRPENAESRKITNLWGNVEEPEDGTDYLQLEADDPSRIRLENIFKTYSEKSGSKDKSSEKVKKKDKIKKSNGHTKHAVNTVVHPGSKKLRKGKKAK